MRIALIVAPLGRGGVPCWWPLHGTVDRVERVRVHAADRAANEQACDDERVVRLPRRFNRRGARFCGIRTAL